MRTIKIAEGAFNKINGSKYEISSYGRFINMETTIKSSPESESLLQDYQSQLETLKPSLNYMATLEDLIILHRIYQNPDIVLSTQREYVYARQACPQDEKKNNDIRICIGLKENYSENIHTDKKLMDRAISEVRKRLDILIHTKSNELENLKTPKKKSRKKS
jgi:hypothetical protein